MTRSRRHRRVLPLRWVAAAIAACATSSALARQDRAVPDAPAPASAPAPGHASQKAADPAGEPAVAAASRAVASGAHDGGPPTPAGDRPAGDQRGGDEQAGTAPASAAPAPAAAPVAAPPDPTDGDRTALIREDVARHPPQQQILSRDPSHLQTAKMRLGGLLDRSVHSLENNEVGRVIDVMIGDDGKPAALELDVGGFLGVGNRRIAVAWSLFDLSRTGQNDPLRVALSAAQVRSAPAMEESGEIQVVTGAAPIAPGSAAVPAGAPDEAGPVAPAPAGIAAPVAAPNAAAPVAVPPAPVPSAPAPPAAASPVTASPAPATPDAPPSASHGAAAHGPASTASPAAGPAHRQKPADAERAPASPPAGDRPAATRHGDRDPGPPSGGGGEDRF